MCSLCRYYLPDIISAPTIDIDSYPVPTECRESLEKIAGNYVVRDFVVWDVDGKRIPPQDISSKLPGALVECYFGITHHSFGGDDTFGGTTFHNVYRSSVH
jgi:hypothetical protein